MNSPDEIYDKVNNTCHAHAVSTLMPAAIWLLLVNRVDT